MRQGNGLKDLRTGEAWGLNFWILREEGAGDPNSWILGEEGLGIQDSWVLRRRALGAWTAGSMKMEAGEGGEGLKLNTLKGLEFNILDQEGKGT